MDTKAKELLAEFKTMQAQGSLQALLPVWKDGELWEGWFDVKEITDYGVWSFLDEDGTTIYDFNLRFTTKEQGSDCVVGLDSLRVKPTDFDNVDEPKPIHKFRLLNE